MFSTFHILPHFLIPKCIPSNNHYVRIHKTGYVNFRNGQNGGALTMCSIHSMSSILIEFEQQGSKKTMRKKKQKNEQPWSLAYTLILQTMNSP
jgi:hypothetical protein